MEGKLTLDQLMQPSELELMLTALLYGYGPLASLLGWNDRDAT